MPSASWGFMAAMGSSAFFRDRVARLYRCERLFSGNSKQFGLQLRLVFVTAEFSLVGTYCILKAVDEMVGLRISSQEEELGLDLSQQSERVCS